MNIESPKDAEGREIPLDTRRLYDENGEKKTVLWFEYSPTLKHWTVVPDEGLNVATCASSVSHLYLTPPDSWEKLEEDIRRIGTDDCTWFCGYANENPVENACPDSCKFFKGDKITCRKKLADDIVSRIRKLRGESDA